MESTATSIAARTRPRGVRVLVVDDEECVREVFSRALASAGCEVRTARTAIEALDALANDPADVVVTDLLMPGLRGELLTEQLRARFPALRVIVVSGWISPTARPLLAASGVDVVLTKPLATFDPLVAAVLGRAAQGVAS